jgi:5-oxopent-3-ene-1,2,5-tricarboxylate decarboxylase / 2-hydroxyhepta-2,4-diene-1,7-dioate isomerase
MELNAPHGLAEPIRLRAPVAPRELDRAGRDACHVLVPLEGREAVGKRREERIVRRCIGELDRKPADLGPVGEANVAAGRTSEELGPKADSERGDAGGDDALEKRDLRTEPSVQLVFVRVGRPAEDEHRPILSWTVRTFAEVEPHLDHPLAVLRHHLAEERRTAAVAVNEREDIHVANVYIRAMKHVRIDLDGRPVWGVPAGAVIELPNKARIAEDNARYLAPAEPTKIVATHLTYRSRAEEYRMARLPSFPSYFLKPPSSLSAHRAPVARPRGCRFLNYEGEIAVVIGRRCLGASVDDALRYVRGYTVANDWGLHDFRHADRGSMLRVKGQDGFCPLGPVLVDAGDVDPADLTIRTYRNGELVQEGHTGRDLLFSFAYQIADVSRLVTLEPGDVLLTGTPANSRPVEPGDVVAVEVDGMGRLENTVVDLERELETVGEQPAVTANALHVALAIPEDEAERQAGAA